MKTAKSDRRVKYTKAVLLNALVELMQQQHISSISVKALCELADINRSTFYAHYSDPYALLKSIEQDVLAQITKCLEGQVIDINIPVPTQILARILTYIRENASLFRVLLSENCDFAFQKDVAAFALNMPLQTEKPLDNEIAEYLHAYTISGCISIIQRWLNGGTKETTELIAEIIAKVYYHGSSGFL